eukprot:8846-Eustigmatos_ZCMA.PRE.1
MAPLAGAGLEAGAVVAHFPHLHALRAAHHAMGTGPELGAHLQEQGFASAAIARGRCGLARELPAAAVLEVQHEARRLA